MQKFVAAPEPPHLGRIFLRTAQRPLGLRGADTGVAGDASKRRAQHDDTTDYAGT